MRKFTESLNVYSREAMDELAQDFADNILGDYELVLQIDTGHRIINVSDAEIEEFDTKHQLYITCRIFNLKGVYNIDELGLVIDTRHNFPYFKELIDDLEMFLGNTEAFGMKPIIEFSVDDSLYIRFPKEPNAEDYFDILTSILDDYQSQLMGTMTPKVVGNKWIIEVDVEQAMKHINSLSDRGIKSYFEVNSFENPSVHEEYIKNPMTVDKWKGLIDDQRHEEIIELFRYNIYSDLVYDHIKSISPTKFHLFGVRDTTLSNYEPKNFYI